MEESKMDALLKLEKKQVTIGRIRLIITVLVFLVVAGIAGFIVYEAGSIQKTIQSVQTSVEQINMDEVNQAITSVRKTAEEISQVRGEELNALIASVQEVADNLSAVKSDDIQSVIESLKGAADMLTKFGEGFKGFTDVFGGLFSK